MTKVSVLVPIYNSGEYLENCLESAQNQSLTDIEIICINDGSDDNSIDIIKKFQNSDSRFKLINKKNSGYGPSLNTALEQARGEYISILEADDFMSKNMLEALYSKASYPVPHDIVKSSFYFYYPKENKCKRHDFFPFCATFNVRFKPEILALKPTLWSAIYRREFLAKNNIKFSEQKNSKFQDVSFQFKAFYQAGNIALLNIPFYYYRQNKNQSVKSKNNIYDIMNEFTIIDDFLENKNISNNMLSQKILLELRAYIWNYKRTKSFKFLRTASKRLKNTKCDVFLKDKKIPLKDKIKFLLLTRLISE